MEATGEPFLDDASMEFRRLGNIDVFNNAVTWAFQPYLWRELMTHKADMMAKGQVPPDVINDEIYATSPFAAVFKKIVREGPQPNAAGPTRASDL